MDVIHDDVRPREQPRNDSPESRFITLCAAEHHQQTAGVCLSSGLFHRLVIGGIGIGGGVMLNVTRILFVVQVGLLLLNTVLSVVQTGDFFPAAAWSAPPRRR